MERRYLVAALAIIATFAGLSHGFRSLQRAFLPNAGHQGAIAKAKCNAEYALRAMARLRSHLDPSYPEEAQMLAEMNAPLADMQAQMAEQMASQNARCARALAMREAERARREAIHMQQNAAGGAGELAVGPISLQLDLPADLDQQIQIQSAAIARMAAENARLHIAADRMRQISLEIPDSTLSAIDLSDVAAKLPNITTRVHCKANTAWRQQMRHAIRNSVPQIQ